ncbi:ion channel [Fulvimarina sp. 2208YS6-2-32]|uniref:Ion channel n=2 Tax=Fulvimarina uroteuthidis TaxID=3098149 RepID=A0ABU5I4S8_9HYPH|nr:ion channel [Fulvimarina sp. 2208YS6-2-32]MDY8110400.1 ion channel [Fulvimarina sp. 2208YS6-2-32]
MKFARHAYVALAELTWAAVLFLFIAHLALSYGLLRLAGETGLTGDVFTYIYYYGVTATTVGYGDLSPGGMPGRMLATFFVIPGAIAIFTAVLGKLLTGISGVWRKRMQGAGDYSARTGHMLVLGWQEGMTRQLMTMLASERTDAEPLPVLLARSLEENPMSETIDFVRSERLADPEALERGGIMGARGVIVRGENDDETLAAALVAATLNPAAHVVAHFEFQRTADIAARQASKIETITSLSPELLVRAARDPGSSQVAKLLLSAGTADTAFSMDMPEGLAPLSYGKALIGLRARCNATLVGIGRNGKVDLNCPDDAAIGFGDTIYYISDHRLDAGSIDWNAMEGGGR